MPFSVNLGQRFRSATIGMTEKAVVLLEHTENRSSLRRPLYLRLRYSAGTQCVGCAKDQS